MLPATGKLKLRAIYVDTITMKVKIIFFLAFLLIFNLSFATDSLASAKELPNVSTDEKISFNELWTYVLVGKEDLFDENCGATDVCYFGATVGTKGQLVGVPSRDKLERFKGRVHLVIADTNHTSTHFMLNPKYPLRKAFIRSILDAAKDFDGVQIDFEYVLKEDKKNLHSFLKELRRRLPSRKIFSLAIPARIRKLKTDLYDYDQIVKMADKLFVMAYDEHWSGSKPGPVASLSWCDKVAAYAASVIPADKLVMGQPFYGRAWSDDTSRGAYKLTSAQRIIDEQKLSPPQRKDGISYIKWKVSANVTLFYDDLESIYARSKIYKKYGITATGFWRTGLEDPEIWNLLEAPSP